MQDYPQKWARITQSVQRLATGWTVRGSNPGGSEIFRTRPHRPWGPPSLLYNGCRVFLGCKGAGAWRWPPTPSGSGVKERVELHLYSSYGSSWPVIGWSLPFTLNYKYLNYLKFYVQLSWQIYNLQHTLQFNNCYVLIVYQVRIYNNCSKCPLQSRMGTSDHGMLQPLQRPGAVANGLTGIQNASVTVLSCSVLSYPVLSCPVLSCPVLSCPVLSCPVLFCSVLFCSVLFCSVLFWTAVEHNNGFKCTNR